jgi:hypothetical protein
MAGDLMSGTNGSTTTNTGTVLTVPASGAWTGYVTLSGTLASGAGVQGAGSAAPSVTVSGAGGNYADGTVVTKLQLNTPAQALGALSGSSCHGSVMTGYLSVQAGAGNDVLLILNTGGATGACGTSIGE